MPIPYICHDGTLPTEAVSFRRCLHGINVHLGSGETIQCYPLEPKTVVAMQEHYERLWNTFQGSPQAQYNVAAGAFALIAHFVASMRPGEPFDILTENLAKNLVRTGPFGQVVGLILRDTRTKGNPTSAAVDVWIAGKTDSGIECFRWAERVVAARRLFETVAASDYLFVTESGAQWTSGYYLDNHLRPVLALLKAGDHPGVAGIDWDRIGVRCLRRGANQRRRRLHMDESLQKLLGRWSDRSLKGEKMHVRYDELNLEDFVNATKPL